MGSKHIYAGRAPQRTSAPATVKCAFCDKKFTTLFAAKAHETAYHKKLLKKLEK